MKYNKIVENITLDDAILKCRDGNFMTHELFDSKQSMHFHDGILYYEDGANLNNHISWLKNRIEMQNGWSIKFIPEQIDKEKLTKMHNDNKDYMLRRGSYEECVISSK